MTAVAFHFNVSDRRAYTCRLLRKAYRAGARVVVTGESVQLAELDRLLWTFEALEFIPHWRGASVDALPPRLQATPVLLATEHSARFGHDVLVNLGREVPQVYTQYQRVIEVVGQDTLDRDGARVRWRQYSTEGCSIERHEVRA
jgi:DNA polymerase III subunit chi